MTLLVSCNHVPSHQIEITLIHIAMNVICLQWHLSLGWLRHHRLVVSIVVRRHHQSVLTPINYKRSIKAKETTSFKCLNHLKKSKRRWVLYNQQNKLLEGEYLHSGLPVRFLEVQSVSRRKMCNKEFIRGWIAYHIIGIHILAKLSGHALKRSLWCGEKLSVLRRLTPIYYWLKWMLKNWTAFIFKVKPILKFIPVKYGWFLLIYVDQF